MLKKTKLLLLGIVFSFGLMFVQAQSNQVSAASNIDAVLSVSGTKYIGQQFSVDVRIDTDGNAVDTVSMRNLNFDNSKIQYISTSVQTIFSSQTTLINTGASGSRRLDIGKLPLTANYSNTSHATFARITFLAINTGGGPTGNTNISFDFDATPATTGSFLAGVKNLAGVTGLTINLAEDNTAPVISNCIPTAGSTGVAVTTSVRCDVQDFETGIHLAGTTLTVNGVTYSNSGPNQYSTATISGGFRLTVNPASQFAYFSDIPVSATAQDNAYDNGPVLARNSTTLPIYTFKTEDDNDAPEIYSRNPNIGAINIATDTNVNFSIRDIASPGGYPGTGVDLASLQITISAPGWGPVTYTQSGANTFSTAAINSPWNYTISINPSTDFPQNVAVSVNVVAADFDNVAPAPNTLNTSYSFNTLDSTPPVCTFVSPNPGSVDNLPSVSAVVKCQDSGSGVDIGSLIIIFNGVAYFSSGANVFAYSGTPAEYTITIDPASNFNSNYAFELVVMGEDFSNNPMQILSYGLATGTTPTTCEVCTVCAASGSGNASPGQSSAVCNGVNSLVNIARGVQIKETVVQVPFRTTEAELQNIQLYRINDIEIGIEVERVEISGTKITFSGIAQQYANVTLLLESNPLILTTIADKDGKWIIEVQNILEPGEHKVFGIARNEKTGEIVQKTLFAYLDIKPQPTSLFSAVLLLCVLTLLALVVGLIAGYKFAKRAESSQSTKPRMLKKDLVKSL